MLDAPQPAAEQGNPYTALGPPDPLIFEQFEGINTATTRPGVDDKQAYWLDGYMPLGPYRNLRTLPGVGPVLWTAPAGVVFFQFANIGPTPYKISVLSDGSIWAVNTNTAVALEIAGPGTILSPSVLNVGITQYGSQYVQVIAKQTNGYFIWDGTTIYGPGAVVPGIGPVPLAIGGTAIENYSGRVWIANGATITFSAPGSLVDFSSANGGGNFTSTDSFLRVRFTQLKQTNGFLYLIGDSSVNYISGVQTSGSPPVTTFTNQNADPEAGSPWPTTVTVFNRNIIFANAFGAQVSYGGAVTKISEMLDGVYNTVENFGNIIPSASKAIIFGKKVWMLLLPIIDPISNLQVNKLLMWNGKQWWASMQDVALTFIQFQEIDSVLTAWGTDGTSVYPLFAQPSIAFEKIAQTKLWDKPGGYTFYKDPVRLWLLGQYYSFLAAGITVDIDTEKALVDSVSKAISLGPDTVVWTNNSAQVVPWTNNSAQLVTWYTSGASFALSKPIAIGNVGTLLGMTIRTFAADMALISASMQPKMASNRQ